MNRRHLIIGASIAVCLVALSGVCLQQRQLACLRDEQLQLLEAANSPPAEPVAEAVAASIPELRPAASPSSELLQLRSRVAQLTARQHELQGARGENEQLRAQIAARGTNTAAGGALPPGYIRKRDAQWVGSATPENALQSFLWATQNRDLTNLLSLLTPESAAKLVQEFGDSAERFFNNADHMPGLRILNQQQLPDGSFQAEIEIEPGVPAQDKVRFKFLDGQWKLEIP